MASTQVNDLRVAFLIAAIMVQEELDEFVGSRALNDLEKRYATNEAAA